MKMLAPILVTVGAAAAMTAFSAWAWPHVPAMAPVHWGVDGRADRFGSRAEALLMLPAITLVVGLGRIILPYVMPAQGRLERSATAYNVIWMAATALLVAVHVALVMRATGAPVDMPRLAVGACGALALVTGNMMGKVRYNYAMGLRTPWTLASERVWDRTHRVFGPMVMLSGLGGVVLALIGPPAPLMLGLFIAIALAPAAIGSLYAFALSRRLEAQSKA